MVGGAEDAEGEGDGKEEAHETPSGVHHLAEDAAVRPPAPLRHRRRQRVHPTNQHPDSPLRPSKRQAPYATATTTTDSIPSTSLMP